MRIILKFNFKINKKTTKFYSPIKRITMSTTDNQLPLWEVFIQSKSGTPHKHAGSIHASDKNMALENARDIYTRRGEGRNIWVVLSDQIAASKTEDEAEFFDPADDKVYRHPTFYKVPEGVKHM